MTFSEDLKRKVLDDPKTQAAFYKYKLSLYDEFIDKVTELLKEHSKKTSSPEEVIELLNSVKETLLNNT